MSRKKRHKRSSQSSGLLDSGGVTLHLIRLLLGLVFVFSGFVKAVDPKGTVFKIEDYLTAFGGFFENLSFLAFPGAILLILIELVIGLMLLFQVRFKLVSWLAFAFLIIMTGLTLYVALYNPVTDCGCFGDALKLGNWETFAKNVVFLFLIIVLLIYQKKFHSVYLIQIEWIMVGVFAVAGLSFMIYNLFHEPVIDFRPYKIGVNISEAMKIPEGAPTDSTETTFIYVKDGHQQHFTLKNLPDSTWKFVDQDTKVIRKGYTPAIHDFTILTNDFEDITQQVLEYPGKTYLFVMVKLEDVSEKGGSGITDFIRNQKDTTIHMYALTSSSSDDIRDFKLKNKLTLTFCKMDPVTLKTMIRANPGVILIENGTVQNKWHWRDLKKQ